ncbi:OmpA/MotB domain protein [uncultured delta proteobacterium]|uniref:OmpA/MotB domain protein n=1 Tax=uncultured delta proteobacterium TaxID=34034 RepID=A0A212J763_9DELT|nr:OmpA/MotB domain protein [uncultured delta proteobacterium]
MKFFKSFALLAAMTLMFAVSATAAPVGNLIPKINSFDFLVDQSGSMMMSNNSAGLLTRTTTKAAIAKEALFRVNDEIPALGYSGGMHTFAPLSEVLPQSTYNQASMKKAIESLKTDLPIYGRLTPWGDSIGSLAGDYNRMSRKAGVIMVTDGNSNLGSDPVAQVTALYNANPDICVHVISVADKPEGKAAIQKIASMRSCSVVVEAAELVRSDAAVQKFVADVFYDVAGGRIDLRSVQFGFDSAVITDESAAILDEVAKMLQGSPRNLEIGGHTCSIGSDEYNMGLSQRRANAVKNYLAKKGIPAASMTAVGYGESQPKFDNRTEEGRRLNRRAEIN